MNSRAASGLERKTRAASRVRRFFLVVLVACGSEVEELAPPRAELGADVADVQRCLGCHSTKVEAWNRASSHSLLFDCRTCHEVVAESGSGHAIVPECSRCHSEGAHAGSACRECHDPHGSVNLYMLRAELRLITGELAGIEFTALEGASEHGLVRTASIGVQGSGLCETCHTETRVYRRSAGGARHHTRYCPECHLHRDGFAVPR
ncbi:MAG: hypothetical protein HY791_11860 [Deltaproteobacteria bacterium]|nr:hypothetical protein [Deltaproteobacteria bacterium]